ncbi:MAG: glutamate--tRNA ligase [Pseudomonadota bacterium]|nr:glutamate--tRNA ligase [Pseudomonadota bacterium]
MSIRTRFAPSPTGLLHVGNARAALFCFLFAKKHDGQFVLRLDDTDRERSTQAFADAIQADLDWLGLKWDDTARQSDRFERYDGVFETLVAQGHVYACYETPEELERKRKRQLARGKPPVYDRAGLALSADEKAALEAEGRSAHWRFKLSGNQVAWRDLVRGEQKIDTASVSDPVIRRADGSWLYTLPSVVDDLDMNISHVIRGEDHVTNTAAQVELIAALGGEVPEFAHFSLMLGADGSGLSKRLGSLALADLRDSGLEPISLNAHIARLGTADPVVPAQTMQEIIDGFDMARLGRAPARFDPEDVTRLNARILHETPYAAVAERLAEIGAPAQAEFWEAMRGNIEKFADMKNIMALINGPITPVVETDDADYIAQACALLPDAPLDTESWSDWTGRLKDETGRKGRALFMPLRMALTGQSHGPEMQHLLYHIGYDEAVARLEAAGKH